MEMAARPRGGPAGRQAAGRAGRHSHISTFGFVGICKSMKFESLASILLRRISLIFMKPKGLVWKWQPAPAAGARWEGGRRPGGPPAPYLLLRFYGNLQIHRNRVASFHSSETDFLDFHET